MGTQLGEILPRKAAAIGDFSGKILAVDAYNAIYQFLTTIRQPDGTPLMDGRGRVTSHLAGLLYRTTNLLGAGVRQVYVFDGRPSALKRATLDRRREVRERAEEERKAAVAAGDAERARSKAAQAVRITDEYVEESRRLLSLLGVPMVQAAAEGEAQAALLVRAGHAWAVSSQDYDSILFGAPLLVRNLAVSGRRRVPRTGKYITVEPEVIEAAQAVQYLGITREQMVDAALLVGTDFNEGVRGIGPKRALKLVKEHGSMERILAAKGWSMDGLADLRKVFLEPQVAESSAPAPGRPDPDGVRALLCGEFGFSGERVEGALRKAFPDKDNAAEGQSTLEEWFG